MKSYPAPWKGHLLLACKRCQKKLRKSKNPPRFANISKWMKARLRDEPEAKQEIHLINIPCQNICPKHGIVLFQQSQLVNQPARFAIISNQSQLNEVYESVAGHTVAG